MEVYNYLVFLVTYNKDFDIFDVLCLTLFFSVSVTYDVEDLNDVFFLYLYIYVSFLFRLIILEDFFTNLPYVLIHDL